MPVKQWNWIVWGASVCADSAFSYFGAFRVFRGCIRESRETRGTSVHAQQTGQETAIFTGFRGERIKRAATQSSQKHPNKAFLDCSCVHVFSAMENPEEPKEGGTSLRTDLSERNGQ